MADFAHLDPEAVQMRDGIRITPHLDHVLDNPKEVNVTLNDEHNNIWQLVTPGGWGAPYWWNTATGQTQWKSPAAPSISDATHWQLIAPDTGSLPLWWNEETGEVQWGNPNEGDDSPGGSESALPPPLSQAQWTVITPEDGNTPTTTKEKILTNPDHSTDGSVGGTDGSAGGADGSAGGTDGGTIVSDSLLPSPF